MAYQLTPQMAAFAFVFLLVFSLAVYGAVRRTRLEGTGGRRPGDRLRRESPAHRTDPQEQRILDQRTETALEHGGGLGLWLVTWLASLSGGDLSFGRADSGGSVVTLELPAGD